MLRVLGLCSSPNLFPRWVSYLCIQNLLHVFWAQAHRTGVSVMRREQHTSSPPPGEQSHWPLHRIAQSQQKAEKNINSDLILLGILILVNYTVSGWVLERKQLQPSFSCYFWLCWTYPTPLWWGRKLSATAFHLCMSGRMKTQLRFHPAADRCSPEILGYPLFCK